MLKKLIYTPNKRDRKEKKPASTQAQEKKEKKNSFEQQK